MNNEINKDKQPEISIIVPVYQVESYLKQCIDSILTQSFHNYELILIDDGSIDNSGVICDEYAKQDHRIKVFHQSNKGLSASRNIGLDNAYGKYITFIDSDDVLLSDDYLKILYDSLQKYNAEISITGHISFKDNAPLPKPYIDFQSLDDVDSVTILNGYQYNYWKKNEMKISEGRFFPNPAHGKLYRKDLFNQVRFPEGRIYETVSIQHLLTLYCERIAFVNASMYGYRIREHSIETGTNVEKKMQDMIKAYQERIDYYNREGYPELASYAEQALLRWLNNNK